MYVVRRCASFVRPRIDPSASERISTVLAELKACSNSRDLQRGKTLHEAARNWGDESNIYIATTLVNMYAKCGSMPDAREIFDKIDHPNVVSWNALISGYADNGQGAKALDLFAAMKDKGLEGEARAYVAALKACTDLALQEEANEIFVKERSRDKGIVIHLLASGNGWDSDVYVQTTLVDMYAKCGSMEDAYKVFSTMEHPNAIAWTALILGYADDGQGVVALDLFSRMRSEGCAPDVRTFVAVLKACIDMKDEGRLERGKQLHLLASVSGSECDIFVRNTLVDMYVKCGNMENARNVFDDISFPDVVSWTALIFGYADNGDSATALEMFAKMRSQGTIPNHRTFSGVLKACCDLEISIETGKVVHFLASTSGCDSDVVVQTTLVDMYARCGYMRDACNVFDSMKPSNATSWTNVISGYAVNGEPTLSIDLFCKMRRDGFEPEARTFIFALKSCTELSVNDMSESRERGKQLHILTLRNGCDSDAYVECTLLDMYAKCRSMQDAHAVFEKMREKDVVSWNALIFGYADNGEGQKALDLYKAMLKGGCAPDERTFIAALKGCTLLGAIESGKAIHAEIRARGFQEDINLSNCLLDFYAKCGNMDEAENVFQAHAGRNLITWNALMGGYSCKGDINGVFDVFERLERSGLQPNGIIFKCILTTCNHGGLVDKAKDYFHMMTTKYGISPNLEHYTCMLDILGRANRLEDAMVILRGVPFTLTAIMWMTILAACKKWKNVELGKLAFESLTCLDEKPTGAYVLMANIFKSDEFQECNQTLSLKRSGPAP